MSSSHKKVAVVLSGCGVYDGSEIHEATCMLIHLSKAKAKVDVFAPDMDQDHVTNHATHKQVPEKRNCLVESARISRGNVTALSKLNPADYDALFFPGGFGAATNLCNFASASGDCKVIPDVEKAIKAFHDLQKPIGLCCIAPVLAARCIKGAHVTIGTDPGTAGAIEEMGAHHENCQITEVCVDQKNFIVTAPAYMCGTATIADIYENIGLLVQKVFSLIK
ncbi:unnamed protein product [Hymenolepis diminuta]|nr:unnamed protein product [Hymenolepis diminuta]